MRVHVETSQKTNYEAKIEEQHLYFLDECFIETCLPMSLHYEKKIANSKKYSLKEQTRPIFV